MAAEELIIDEWVIRLDGKRGRAAAQDGPRQGEVEALFAEARKRRDRLG